MKNKKKACHNRFCGWEGIKILIILLFTFSLSTFGYLIIKENKIKTKEISISEKHIEQARQAEIEMQDQVRKLQEDILNGKKI
ncbi:hypothetical protein ISS03_04855 [Patescibacteria group bacterium]|nr:hypothetical protein [Patescibacteria group bacterium]